MAKQKTKPKAMRVSQLAKKAGRSSQELIELANSLGLDVKSHASNVSEEEQKVLLNAFKGGGKKRASQAPPDPGETAPLSLEEISGLASSAVSGLAARCAMRVMPLIAPGKSQGVIEEEEGFLREIEIAGLIAASSAVQAFEGDRRELNLCLKALRAREAQNYLVVVGAGSASETAFHAVSTAVMCVQSILHARQSNTPPAELLSESLRSSAAAVKIAVGSSEAAHAAARSDYHLLQSRELTDTGQITPDFFEQCLWPSGIPEAWGEILKKWEISLEKFRCPDILGRYMKIHDGKGMNWEEVHQVTASWVERYGARLEAMRIEGKPSAHAAGVAPGLSPTQIQDGPSTEDLLGRETLVEALASIFKHSTAQDGEPGGGDSFIIGLLGNCGIGKSSVMEQLKDRLKKPPYTDRFLFTTFNAWQYEQTENMAAGMAQEVVKGLTQKITRREKWKLRYRFAKEEYRGDLGRIGIKLGLAAASFILALIFPQGDFASFWGFLKSMIGLGAAGATVAVVVFLFIHLKKIIDHPIAAELQTYLRLPKYDRHLGLVPVLQSHIKTLCRLRLNKDRRLVVFVDDLDRCRSDCIAKTLDAIRLVMNINYVIVMILIDHRIAFEAVKNHYEALADKRRGSSGLARDYLGKIIQLPIRLLAPSKDSMKTYINVRLFPDVEESGRPPASASATQAVGTGGDKGAATASPGTGSPASRDGKGKEPSPASGGASTSTPATNVAERLEKKMKESSEEREEFSRLAFKFHFRNPRRLLRMRNAYRLLKLLNAQLLAEDAMPPRDIMTMLFWQEFLHGMPEDQRNGCMARLWNRAGLADFESADVGPVLENVCGEISDLFPEGDHYSYVAHFVRMLVLPHGEEGILDTPEQVEAWAQAKAAQ